jgi:AcrR family transcriptional regulator
MSTHADPSAEPRLPLTRERVLATAVALADRGGIGALSMRKLAQELGVVPMALYKHVANKDELLDGMIDVVVAEIDPPIEGADWKTTMRERILSAKEFL